MDKYGLIETKDLRRFWRRVAEAEARRRAENERLLRIVPVAPILVAIFVAAILLLGLVSWVRAIWILGSLWLTGSTILE